MTAEEKLGITITLIEDNTYCLACGGEVFRNKAHICYGVLGKLIRRLLGNRPNS